MTGCIEVELLLATGGTAERSRPDLLGHLEGCDACMRLARELENPVVADALDEACEASNDLPELTIVPSENYRRGKEIGRGGMGRIVRARDRRLGRAVAIKELLDDRMRARFEREARLTARLQHPAIVSVHEVGRWPSGSPFYAMKFVAGRPLNAVIADRPALAGRLALLPNIVTVVEAIAYAHSERVIHRDLKPHNILIGPFGETVVIDWGLAKELGGADGAGDATNPFRDEGAGLTRAGAGTPEYMPPEQARGETPDERVDVYALGATLHHLLAGAPPGRGAALPAATPPELAAVVAKAMAPAPADRYPSARELADELIRFQSGQLVGAHRYSLGQLAGRWLRRHRTVVALASAFIVALGGVGAVSVARIVAARREAVAERDAATHAYAELLVEHGRQELQQGSAARALTYLHAALAQGVDTPAVRFLIAEARRSTASLLLSTDDGGRGVARAALGRDGSLLAVAPAAGPARVIDVATGKVRFELPGHFVRGLLFDPKGERLLVFSDGPDVEIWDLATGQLVASPTGAERVEGARFHTDGRVLVWGGKVVRVWSRAGTLEAKVAEADDVLGAALDPAGKLLATASRDGSVRLWDAASGAPIRAFSGHTSGVSDVAFDGEGRRIVTAGWDERARIFDVATGAQLQELRHDESLRAVAFSSDGALVLGSGSYSAHVWKLDGGVPVTSVRHGGRALGTASFLPDGNGLLVARADGSARIYGTDGRQGELFEGHDKPLVLVAASGDAGRVVTVAVDGTAKVWQTGGARAPVALPGGKGSFAFDAAGRLAARVGPWLELWDVEHGRLLASQYDGAQLAAEVIPARDGVHLFEIRGKHTRWDPETGAIVGPEGLDQGLRPLAHAPAAGAMVAGDFAAQPAKARKGAMATSYTSAVVADSSGHRVRKVPMGNPGDRVVLSPDGAWMGIGGGDILQVWETGTSDLVQQMSGLPQIRDLALHAPSGTIVLVDENDQGTLWDARSRRFLRALRGRPEGMRTVTISSDGLYVLSGADDGSATLWDTRSGKPLATWTLPSSVTGVAFSPDGRRALVVASGSSWLLDVSADDRSADAIGAELAARVPFRYQGGSLFSTTPPPNVVVPQPPRRTAPADLACPAGAAAQAAGLVAWCQLPDGKRQGVELRWWPAGGKLSEVHYDHGMPIGRATMWDAAGRVSTIVDLDGDGEVETRYHPDGARASVLRSQGAQPVGEYRAWYPDGTLREIGRYGAGAGTGQPISVPSGFWTTYHPDGSKESEGLYAVRLGGLFAGLIGDDLKVGVWTYWDKDGHARLVQHGCPPLSRLIIGRLPVMPQCQ